MKSVRILLALAWGILAFGAPALGVEKGNPEQGLMLYVEYCLQCHGGHGEGWGWSNKVPPPSRPHPRPFESGLHEAAVGWVSF